MTEFKPGKIHDKGLVATYVGLVKKAKDGIGGQRAWDLFTEPIRHALINSEIAGVLNAQDDFLAGDRFKEVFQGLYAIMIDHWGEGFQ